MVRYTKKQILEKKLIKDFRQEFHKQLGYYPIITTEIKLKESDIPILSLNELEECFIEMFPQFLKKPGDLIKKDRHREYVDLRCLFSHFARLMRYKFSAIGRYLSNRHHTSIMHYTALFRNQMDTNDSFVSMHNKILIKINSKKNIDESSTVEHFNQIWS
jgi:hypothetical protein